MIEWLKSLIWVEVPIYSPGGRRTNAVADVLRFSKRARRGRITVRGY